MTPRLLTLFLAIAIAAADQEGFSRAGWKTDFARHSVPLGEFVSGGRVGTGSRPSTSRASSPSPPREGRSRRASRCWPSRSDGRARAYPHQILIWHEIVNDTLAGRPIAVTYCPSCNSSVVFVHRVGDRELTFGTTGNLRNSDLVLAPFVLDLAATPAEVEASRAAVAPEAARA